MTTTVPPLDRRLLSSTIGALELFGVYLGDRLGLYRALRDAAGACTPGDLATACGLHPRYAREWLEQQAVAGVLQVENHVERPEDRREMGATKHRFRRADRTPHPGPCVSRPASPWPRRSPPTLPSLLQRLP